MTTYLNNDTFITNNRTDTDDCIIIEWNATIPWDNPKNLISLNTKNVIEKVMTAIIIPILFFIGAPANIINMIVFFKQDLGERINLCLFSLALVDFLYLLYFFIYYADGLYLDFSASRYDGIISVYMTNNNVMGLTGIGYASAFISTIIAVERCICVLFPIRAQRCIPTKILGVMIVVGSCVTTSLCFVVTAKYHVACFYEMRTGRISRHSSASKFYLQNKEMINILGGVFYGFCLAVGCPVIVLITTIITAIKLHQTIKWRHRSSSTMSDKEIGVTKMLIWLSFEFFVLSVPRFVLRVLPMFGTQLHPGGHHSNTLFALISFALVCVCTNATVSFFVYYFTGSRYRQTLHRLIGCKSSSERNPGQSHSSQKTMETQKSNDNK